MRGRDRSGKQVDGAITRPLILLGITVLIDLLGFGIVLPNLPQYIELAVGKDHRHAAFIAGLLAASYSLTQFLCAPFWGSYSDRAGRRPVILISLIGVGISYIFFGFANGSLTLLFIARLLAGLLSSASIGVAFAYVADVTSPENRAVGMGLLGACFGLGFAFGPVVGGLLGTIDLALPAFVAAGMAFANFVLSYFLLPESLTAGQRTELARRKREAYPAMMRRVLKDPASPLFLVTFILTFGFAAIEQAFGFFLMARGIATPETQQVRQAYLLGFVGVVGIVLQGFLIGPLVRRFGEGLLVRLGLAILTVGYVLLLIPREWGVMVFVATLFVAFGRSMIGPAATSLISRRTRVGQGLIQSSSQGFDALARTVGPLTAGALFNALGPTAPYVFSAGLTVLALFVTFVFAGAMTVPPQEAVEVETQNTEAAMVSSGKVGAVE
ncbi:MAG: MFS transporter [Capsulimonadales bacterium]|nr:MFS transporter [Capsulimonadales bacterium]